MSEKKINEMQAAGLNPEAAAEALMYDAAGKLSPEAIVELDPNLADYATNILAVQSEIATLEAGMTGEELALVEQVVTAGDLSEETINRRTDHAPRPNVLRSLLLLLVTLSILLAACAPVSGTEAPVTVSPTVVASQTVENSPTASVEVTSTALADIDINYGRFTGSEAQVDPYIEKAWVLIDQYLVEQGIVAPNGIEIVDVSSENVIVEVISGSGYPEGTMFTISFVQGHSGETLTVSLAGANAVCGGIATELAIGANQLPVALDANGRVVAYVDAVSGQWVAGSTALAGEIVATPEPPAPNYFDLSPAERTEQSQTLVEQANNFSGEVFVPVEINGQTYRFFWSPTSVDKYDTGLTGAWKTENSGVELDKTGETLPSIVVPGYENEDGSLVVVDPVTGEETVYANPNIPALGGVISYRDLYNLPQSKISNMVTDDGLSDPDFGDNPGIVENFKGFQKQSLYLPVMLWGEQTSVFAQGFPNGGGAGQDVPEARYSAIEMPTNNGLVPIYSPETGDFMFFINIMVGNPLGQYNVFYKPDGSIDSKSVYDKSPEGFGVNGLDQFGIIGESRFPRTSHYNGGGEIFNENSPVMGNIVVVEEILNASSEDEVFRILNKYRLLVAYPSIVYRPAR